MSSLPPPPTRFSDIIGRVSPLIARPFVRGREDEGSTMPVKVTVLDRLL